MRRAAVILLILAGCGDACVDPRDPHYERIKTPAACASYCAPLGVVSWSYRMSCECGSPEKRD